MRTTGLGGVICVYTGGCLGGRLACWCILCRLLQLGNVAVDSSYGKVLEANRRAIHDKVDGNGRLGGKAVHQGNEEWPKELAEEVDASHLGVQGPQHGWLLFSNDDHLESPVSHAKQVVLGQQC